MGKIELAEHVVMHCATLLDDACVWHLGTKGMGTPAHRRGASQEHTVGCSRQMRSQFLAEKHGATLSSVGA